MSMGAILQEVRDHLRTALSLGADQCGIQIGGTPPEAAGNFYVAVDELGVESTAQQHLQENYQVEISLWRRLGQTPSDRSGEALLRDDPYLSGAQSLDDLERSVIKNLHANYTDITTAANTAIGAGANPNGDVFQLALYYAGRKRTETWQAAGKKKNPPTWLVRRLKFVGMNRVQALDVVA